MKKFTLILTAALCASAAMAGSFNQMSRERVTPAGKSLNYKPAFDLSKATIYTSDPRQSRGAEDVIMVPPCEAISYTTEYKGFIADNGDCYPGSGKSINNIAYDENGDVYIQDIVSSYGTGAYVKGTMNENGEIRVDFPQTVLYADFGGGVVMEIQANLMKFTYTDKEDGVGIVDEIAENNYVTYTLNEITGVITLNLPEWEVPVDPTAENLFEYGIGLTSPFEYDNGEGEMVSGYYWLACADVNQTKTYFGQYPATVPAGVETEEWAMVAENNYSLVNVAIDQDKSEMYILDINEFEPTAAIVGEIADGKVTFKAPQYMGWQSTFGVPVYFCTGVLSEDGWGFTDESFNTDLVFDYDAANKVLTCTNPEMCIIENAAENYANPFRFFVNPTIWLQNIEETWADPCDPYVLNFYPYDPDQNTTSIAWAIPSININDALIPTYLMYYNLYLDGQLFPLNPDEYFLVPEYMEDIPYDFTDGWDINIGGETHWIFYYIDGIETLGVQSFYAAENGILYSSNRITYDIESGETINEGGAGVPAVESSQIAAIYYTNLLGQRIANPETGLYIKTIVMNDGSTQSLKVMVRK